MAELVSPSMTPGRARELLDSSPSPADLLRAAGVEPAEDQQPEP
jgi:hypothetical protein